jgi:hypothetical protein
VLAKDEDQLARGVGVGQGFAHGSSGAGLELQQLRGVVASAVDSEGEDFMPLLDIQQRNNADAYSGSERGCPRTC